MSTSQVDQAGPVREGEHLDVARLEPYLLKHLADARGPLTLEQFRSGFSNLTYLVRLGSRELVLRRPPFGNPVKSAHDMGREYRVLVKLCEAYGPAPRPLLYCQDPGILGDEFYVMERRRGVILRTPQGTPELRSDARLSRRLGESFIDNLAALHVLDFRAVGLGDLGKPDGYIQRQVSGWIGRYHRAKTEDSAELDRLTEWLAANHPPDRPPALIHNDYKYDNLVLDPGQLTRIVAVLDWEMATIGDPLMDLGTSLAYWIQADDDPFLRERAFGPTMLPGSPTRQELVARYAEQTATDVPDMLFFYSFGLFKLAVIVQQIYARYVRGHTQDPRFAGLNTLVQALGVAGSEAITKKHV